MLEWLMATVVDGGALDHGCGSTDYGVALMLLNFVSVLIFSQRTALGSCLCQQLTGPVTIWSGGNSPVCFLLAHLLGICRDTGLTGAKTGWLIEAKSLPSSLGSREREGFTSKCKCWCGHVPISEHSLEVGSLSTVGSGD